MCSFFWNDANSFRYIGRITVDTISFMSTTGARCLEISIFHIQLLRVCLILPILLFLRFSSSFLSSFSSTVSFLLSYRFTRFISTLLFLDLKFGPLGRFLATFVCCSECKRIDQYRFDNSSRICENEGWREHLSLSFVNYGLIRDWYSTNRLKNFLKSFNDQSDIHIKWSLGL